MAFSKEIANCRRCPRLVAYTRQVAREKRRAYRDWEYWGRPVPPFGDPGARLLILGLAPGAHGANRTGRMFTGDRSGDFLYRALHEAGFAAHPWSRSRDDGQQLTDAYISAAVRCAPPGNKPLPSEIQNCRPYLERELAELPLRVVVALGKIAFDDYRATRGIRGGLAFGHGRVYETAPEHPVLIASYHPSQQNTQTGKLTYAMFLAVFRTARRILEPDEGSRRGGR